MSDKPHFSVVIPPNTPMRLVARYMRPARMIDLPIAVKITRPSLDLEPDELQAQVADALGIAIGESQVVWAWSIGSVLKVEVTGL